MKARPWLLVPVRSFCDGKRRLAGALESEERLRLNQQFLSHVLQEASIWPGLDRTIVVSPAHDVLQAAQATGVRTLKQDMILAQECEPDEQLNRGLEQGRRAILESGAHALLIASCDLPLLKSDELCRLSQMGNERRIIIATDRVGTGTNALYLPSGATMPFCFGINSAKRHVRAAAQIGWRAKRVQIDGLSFDIDTPADYADYRSLALVEFAHHTW